MTPQELEQLLLGTQVSVLGVPVKIWRNTVGMFWELRELKTGSGYLRLEEKTLLANPQLAADEVLKWARQISTKGAYGNGLLGQGPSSDAGYSGNAFSGIHCCAVCGSPYYSYYSAVSCEQSHSAGHDQGSNFGQQPVKYEGWLVGELTGWRGWKVTPELLLKSMTADVVWAPDEPMDGNTKATEEHNGIYAYKKARDFLSKHNEGLDIYGKVLMWGDVIEHELGYRAEYAKIVSLEGLTVKGREHLEALRERYKVAA